MDSSVLGSGRARWLHRLGAVGAILLPLGVLFSFFASGDSGDTSAEVIAYAKDSPGELWFLQIIALLAPLLIGAFVASLVSRLRGVDDVLRALTVIGGTLFISFLSVGLTLWAAPLLSPDELTTAGADAYLAFDDAGWVLLGLGGVGIGTMIIAVSVAVLDRGWLPRWAGWLSLALGIVSLASIAAVGIFAWMIWLFAAGCYLLLYKDRSASAGDTPPRLLDETA